MLSEIFIKRKVNYLNISYPNHQNLNQKLEYDIKSTGDITNRQTYAKAYMTDWKETRFKSFEILSQFVINSYNSYMAHDNVFYSTKDIKDMWGLVYNKGDYAEEHQHEIRNLYSFIYYVKSSKKSSPLIFTDGFPFHKKIQPENGMLIIFPSYMKHKVPVQKYDEERISVAGNF